MARKINGFIYWTPRILSILFVIFIGLFSLDVITPELSIGEIIQGLLIHNVPTFALIIILAIAWKFEIIGGIAFIVAGIAYIIMALQGGIPWYIAISWSLTIAGPAILIGILFLLNWHLKRKT
ncbi:DUF7670 domain-containing protein [Acetobacterium tundrae]|uniref:DUF7670 domain-containing protein n=1 Tax=Acetobacterium tundrae TaxID=132932 RepID=A0ABR6WIK5_9FIRM|nr:hypothetical protein [Acetobacterium tundrae]MBC3796329.1 hypothetical protein [Acetobacterium tundrae]